MLGRLEQRDQTSTSRAQEQYSAVFEELSKQIAAEDKSGALYLDGEVTENSDLKTDSETDLENNPVTKNIETQTVTQMLVSSIH
ncbi:hypothetical protein AVEN_50249-1 [Araneus ventricosus]|uniref:Uncharacterized protein n=1 Tax=Araneus ventricosus TaxID=182803 RepID=A0A4Y2E5X0_ARAVE|nr:hypothetical protein AVEN_50249-1 [Araneus ventricosus]